MEIFDYTDNDTLRREEVEELFEAAFHHRLDNAYWNWRFDQNPYYDKIYLSYARDKGKLVAYYAVSPVRFLVDGQPVDMALSMMTMTHPDYWGRRLFRTLASRVYQRLKEEGFYGVYGFANVNSHYNLKKYLGWRDLNSMLTLSYQSKNLSSEALPEMHPLEQADLKAIEQLYQPRGIAVEKSPAFMQWRLLENPTNTYYKYRGEAGSYLIYKQYQNNSLDVVDYVGDQAAFATDMRAFTELYGQQHHLNIWMNIDDARHLELEKLRYHPASFNSYLGFIPLNSDPKAERYENWRLTMIDSDIF